MYVTHASQALGSTVRWAFATTPGWHVAKTKRNLSVQANTKVFELSKAVGEDGFAERAEIAHKKTSYATAL